jgi:hypothetical protein
MAAAPTALSATRKYLTLDTQGATSSAHQVEAFDGATLALVT